ncbi:MAG: helix-turn-helix transcriptional regulator [Acidobacteriota bacterium]
MSPLSRRKVHLVGSRIRELRKGRRLTQTELSEKIGVAQSDLSRMEQGEYKVGLDTLFKILQVFDLKMGEFFGETGDQDEGARELVSDFEVLSADAQREVRDFVRFKKMQEQEKPAAGEPEAEEKP